MSSAELRSQILDLTREYYAATWPSGTDAGSVNVSGKVFDAEELVNLIDSSLDFWLTTGRYAEIFERQLARFMGTRFASFTNSGSSANLLALTTLTSPVLGERQLRPGDEIITVAAGFPTTVNPILQNNLKPVFVDITLPGYNADVTQIAEALSPRTRAVMLAHTLGNPFDLAAITAFCRKHNLWLIEDCCDALGSEYAGRLCGTFGDLATLSFYPAHHITTGEGGAVLGLRPMLQRIVESLRDWGRDCWCAPGKDNTCGKRFSVQSGELPGGYDHKYTYSHIGYNLKATDMQAAIGVAQMKKLSCFIRKRRANFARLRSAIADLDRFLILPEATPGSNPSWFGFPLTLREDAPVTRNELIRHLEDRNVRTRLLFAGHILRQPAYAGIDCRVIGDLANTERVMNRTFWIGIYPGLSEWHIDFAADALHKAFAG